MVVKSDLRARLTVKASRGASGPTQAAAGVGEVYNAPFYGPGAALQRTRGILFPYTPNISVSQQVEYSQYDLVHTNYQQNAYSKTRNPNIQLTGMFVSQTPAEALYTIGVLHFLRVVTKMNFGRDDPDAGTPPPVLEFSAYGTYNFRRVPVLVGSFSYVYEDGVDYVEVESNGEVIQIPSLLNISIDLLPQYSPAKQSGFSLNDFAQGNAYKGGFM
jgi:hypothetical protein